MSFLPRRPLLPPPIPTPELSFVKWPTPLTIRTSKKGVEFVRKITLAAIERQKPVIPSAIRVQDKLESATRSSMLIGTLASHHLHDLSMVEARRKPNVDGVTVVEKYLKLYGHQSFKDIGDEGEEAARVLN